MAPQDLVRIIWIVSAVAAGGLFSWGIYYFVYSLVEKERANKAFRESEKFKSSLLTNSPNPIIVIDPGNNIIYVNPAMEKLTGFLARELTGRKPPYPWWPRTNIQRAERDFELAKRRGVHKFEELFQGKNGELFWVETTFTPVKEESIVKYYLVNWVETTDRVNAKEALVKEKEYYRSFLESLSDWAWEMSDNGVFSYTNPAVEKLLGYTSGDIIGHHISSLWPPRKNTPGNRERLRKNLAEAKGWKNKTVEYIHKDGTIKEFESTAVPIFDVGKLIGYRGLDRDITRRNEA